MRATIRCVSEREREREREGKIAGTKVEFLLLLLSLSLLCFYHFKMVWKFFDFLNDTPPMAAAVIVLTFGLFEKQHLLPFHTKLFNCLFLLSFLLSSRQYLCHGHNSWNLEVVLCVCQSFHLEEGSNHRDSYGCVLQGYLSCRSIKLFHKSSLQLWLNKSSLPGAQKVKLADQNNQLSKDQANLS